MSESKSPVPSAEAMDLAGMVEYSEGSIVSRTLAESAAGTVTLFAFDAGQGLSEHSAPYDAMVVVLDGVLELTIGQSNVTSAAGQLVVMPANIPHAVKAPRRAKMMLVMLREKPE